MHIDRKQRKIILYGAGKIGKSSYNYLKRIHMEHLVYAFCDANHAEIQKIDNRPILSYEELSEEAKKNGYIFIVCFNSGSKDMVFDRLSADKQKYYKTLEAWMYRNRMKTNIILVRNWNLKRAIDYLLIKKYITGKYNVIEIRGKVELNKAIINISGNYNHIVLGDRSSILETEFRIDDDNNAIHIGQNTYVHKASIFAGEETMITIGDDCLFAKDVTIRSLDGHKIYTLNKKDRLNKSKNIVIGNHVWLAKGCSILKGAVIGNDVVVATNAVVNKEIPLDHCIVGGVPVKILKREITWEY